jgi:hypothetical protein
VILSNEELRGIFAEDTGIKTLLKTMPPDQDEMIRQIICDGPDLLKTKIQLLPAPLREQLENLMRSLSAVPEEALQLYQSCRYFEARSLLQQSIASFANEHAEDLKKAVEDIAHRARTKGSQDDITVLLVEYDPYAE